MSLAEIERALHEVVQSEGRLLDRRQWDDWLALFIEDVRYWVPAWKNEDEPTDAPAMEVSLIYYESRRRLQERVWRVTSRNSISAVPLVRTLHSVTGFEARIVDEAEAACTSNWTVHVFDPRRQNQHVFFGFYEHDMVKQADGWKIASKKTILLNDYIPTLLDFYTI